MLASVRATTMVASVAAMVAAVSVAVPSGSVSACSCDVRFPTVADSIGGADIAFVGRLDATEEIDPSQFDESHEYFDVRYELVVEHAVKGVEGGDRVVMFGNVGAGSSCGTSELEGGQDLYAILSNDANGRFVADSTPPCTSLPSVDELLVADLTLPETSRGPVSVVVVGRVGEAELIAYGADGQPVAYGDLPRWSGRPAVCPGSERVVQLEHDRSGERTVLSIRDVATLEVIDRIDIVTPGVLAEAGEALEFFLVDGAVLDCRSADGRDVAALLSWENTDDDQTMVVRIRPDDAGGVAVRTYGRTSQARHDPISDDVVGVIDGAFVRIDTNADDARVVAQLTMGPEESGFGAVFVEPDGVAGWWVGLGGIDNDYGIADRWRALVRVAADGSIERWPVENAPEYIDTVVLDGDRLVSSEHTIALPAAGSSAVGATVRAVLRDEYSYEFDLGDGRSVRPVADDRASSVELIGRDGGSTRLEHLLEVQHAVGVVDGPTADPESIRREPRTRVVASPWITPNKTPVTVQQPAVSYSTESTVPENPATPIAGANDQSPTRAPDGVAQTESDSSNGWRLGVVVGAALVVGVVVLALIRHRLRRRTA